MKIAIVIPDFPPIIGGAEIFAYEVGKRLAKNHEVHIITRCPTKLTFKRNNVVYRKVPTYEVYEEMHIHRVKFIDVPDIRLLSALVPLYRKLANLIRTHDIDIIHGVMIYPAGQVCALAKKKHHRAFFFTEQGFLVDVIRKEKTISELYGGILRPLIRYALKNADLIHCVSRGVQEKINQIVETNKTIVIPNGVDIDKFKPKIKTTIREKYNIGDDDIVVVSVSRLAHKNGLEYLIRSAQSVSQYNSKVKFLIVGGGPLYSNLKKLADNLKLDNIIFTGNIDNVEAPHYLAASDIFVRPSLTEGFGISFVEAMAVGLPVIGTSAISKYGIIEDDKNGFIVKPKDTIGLTHAITKLVGDKNLRDKMGKVSRKLAIKKFNWDNITREIEHRYKELISKNK